MARSKPHPTTDLVHGDIFSETKVDETTVDEATDPAMPGIDEHCDDLRSRQRTSVLCC
jgi:hypothetical protein